MTTPASVGDASGADRRVDGGPRLVLGALFVIVVLAVATLARGVGGAGTSSDGALASSHGSTTAPGATSGPNGGSNGPIDVAEYLIPTPVPAPPMALTDQDDRPFDLASQQGAPIFVFFGYTHCTDVCPATVGTVGLAMEAFGNPIRAVFVTVDPERDTPAWLHEYVRYLAPGFAGLTGTTDRIAAVARDWGVRYAREETGTPGEYSMSHTADVLLVDARGELRARFPFGTDADAMTATLRTIVATTAPIATPAPSATSPAISRVASEGLDVLVDSTSIWAGPAGPVILGLSAGGIRIDDPDLVASVQLASLDGMPVGSPVIAVAVRPPGETRVLYIASPAIPSPGWWRLAVSADRTGITLRGSTDIAALDPGTTAALGGPAPTAHTPTLDDVAGNARAVTTDPAPALRLSRTSTTDALARHRPFVLVIDSWKFRVTSACGKALVMARYLVDRWPDDAFIHLEPLRYDVVTDTPVLEGSLSAPTLTDPAAAWGLAGDPWGPSSMPWIFVVDGNGIVRSKAEGVLGTDDVDVILAMLAAGH